MGENVRNVIIIGSGPAGYTAGLYTARAMLNPLMFAGYMSGGQLMLTSDIENFPGYPEGIGGPEMMLDLRAQAERSDSRYKIGMSAVWISVPAPSRLKLKVRSSLPTP